MKAYMGYSRQSGPQEGAVLIFANTAKEARRLAWHSLVGCEMTDDWLDVAVVWIKKQPYLFKQSKSDKPHFIDSPLTCKLCEMWGGGDIGEDGICEACKVTKPSAG